MERKKSGNGTTATPIMTTSKGHESTMVPLGQGPIAEKNDKGSAAVHGEVVEDGWDKGTFISDDNWFSQAKFVRL